MILKFEKALKRILVLLSVILLIRLSPAIWQDGVNQLNDQQVHQVSNESRLTRASEKLPAKYDKRMSWNDICVKDQDSLETCWSVAATSALEISLLPEENLVFSADHMSYMNAYSRSLDEGGDYSMIMSYLAGWQGPVLEKDDPYGDGKTDSSLKAVKHVQEMRLLENASIEDIKQAVYNYGVVQASIYMDLEDAFSSSVYYNQLNYSYYYPEMKEELDNETDDNENGNDERSIKGNHDVCIVGWDDNYPAESFNKHTDQNGAFICLNSWGEEFGDQGYFYVSYEDSMLAEYAIVYSRIDDVDHYSNLYQTDLCGWVGMLGYGDGLCYFANTFTAERDEDIAAVGFYATGKDTAYKIYVMDGDKRLEHVAIEKAVAEGTLSDSGYYTIDLENRISIRENEKVTIVIRVETPGAENPVAAEYVLDKATESVILSDGDGYISHNGVVWSGTESQFGCNVCMKMYTVS